jgi:hypothetical protein
MVTIDAVNDCPNQYQPSLIRDAQLAGSAYQSLTMQSILDQAGTLFGQPGRAFRVDAVRHEGGILLQQTGLQLIQFWPQLIEVRPWQIWRLVRPLAIARSIRTAPVCWLRSARQPIRRLHPGLVCVRWPACGRWRSPGFPGGILDRFATVPFGQRYLIGKVQAFVDGRQQRLQGIGCRGGRGVPEWHRRTNRTGRRSVNVGSKAWARSRQGAKALCLAWLSG